MENLACQCLDGDLMRWTAPVARWSVWQDHKDTDSQRSPNVTFVEPSLRRRLSLLARMSLKVAHDCVGDTPSVRIVFASRHGDLARTTSMLVDLADEQILSPTTFSMSVLNACAGIYSIARKEHEPSTAVSAGESTLGYGLLEACIQLTSNPDSPVLFIYADEPAPSIYGIESSDVQNPLAIGLLLKSNARTEIACQTKLAETSVSQVPQSQALLQCLNNKIASTWHGNGKVWNWCWHER
jgi:hypothetical protein